MAVPNLQINGVEAALESPPESPRLTKDDVISAIARNLLQGSVQHNYPARKVASILRYQIEKVTRAYEDIETQYGNQLSVETINTLVRRHFGLLPRF